MRLCRDHDVEFADTDRCWMCGSHGEQKMPDPEGTKPWTAESAASWSPPSSTAFGTPTRTIGEKSLRVA